MITNSNTFYKHTFCKRLNEEKMQSRFFLVGCPRSGTTLLQSILAAHPNIISFPESHFFINLHLQKKWLKWLKIIGISSPAVRLHLLKFIEEIKQQDMRKIVPRYAIFARQYVDAFVNLLDTVAEKQGKSVWIEKTPAHLRYIDYIEKMVSRAKFIHLVRNGADVVASMYEVTHKYPKIWGGARGIDKCIQRWITDIEITQCHLHKINHYLVIYENLIRDPRSVMVKVCNFIDIRFDEIMLEKYKCTAGQLVRNNESWKASVSEPIQKFNSNKFNKVFNLEQKEYILEKVGSFSYFFLDKESQIDV